MLLESSQNCVQNPQKFTISGNNIIYLVRHLETQIFCTDSLERFNMYKRFVENTIMQLGEDWRIQSGLLAQEIMAEKSLTNDEFCIFNEFMAGFLRKRLGHEGNEIHTHSSKMVNEQQGQQEFLKYFNKGLGKCTNENRSTKNDFSCNLTFKTLSLGFYITASDIWAKTFKKYHQDTIEEKINSFVLNQERKLKYFATLEVGLFGLEKWRVQEERELREMLVDIESRIGSEVKSGDELLANAVKLGSIVVNIQETIIKHPSQQNPIIIRTFSICTEFYLYIFLIWLIFSIKKSFNSSLFSPTCFIRYCDIIIGSRICSLQTSKSQTDFHQIYKHFKQLCDDQWKKLMKDYMVALGDDKEVLKTLIKRIGERVGGRFTAEVEGKRKGIR